MAGNSNTLKKFLDILRYEKSDISTIYFYAIFSGLVQLSLPIGIQSIISFVLGGSISTSLVLLIAFVIIGVFVAGWLQVSQMRLIEKIQQQLFVRYSFQYAYTIPRLDLQQVDKYYLPELVNRFSDTISLQKGISKLLLDVPAATIQIVFGLILLSFYHPMFIMFGVLLLTILYLILRATGNKGMETSIEESDYKYRVLAYLEELARVIGTFKFSRNSSIHLHRTDEQVSGYLRARTAHFRILLFQYWTLIGFKVLITAAMLIVGALLLVDQQLNIGQFIAAEIVIIMVMTSVEKLIVNLEKVYDVMTAVEKITKVTDKQQEVSGTLKLATDRNGLSVTIRNLSFRYTDDSPVLRNVDLTINEGDKVDISGAQGAGKSSLLRLMSGAYLNFEGSLLINGVPIHQYEAASLRSNIGVLFSSHELFEGTLYENITLGDDSITYKQIYDLAEVVGLKSFIEEHKEGYNRTIRPAGQHLSGRIGKKLLLMRALIHKPKLLLLEDPLQGIEPQYTARILQYILTELPGVTVVAISNDNAFKAGCNKQVVLENGSITSIKEN
ncbi:MAG: ATP-binding cassette domain-containing protein [Sphingobacteriales bacterium]|nr:MAG: ATP-binding cassette domain-containing protein [Sphingobacteriales bacterium]